MQTTLTERAPAKINLSLHITGRREDGYHLLDSVFVPLALADEVTVVVGEDEATEVSCRCPGHAELDGEHNLAARAARAYLERAGLRARVAVTVQKHVWLAAGLGGGSSDAAAVLRALDRHFSALDRETLASVALSLGADVPYFLAPRPSRVRGIGEVIEPLEAMPPLELLLLNPGVPLSTAAVYGALGLEPGSALAPRDAPALDGSVAAAAALVHNDLQPPAARLCAEIAPMIAALEAEGALAAAMSGSGATTFGVFQSAAAAASAERAIAQKHSYFRALTRSTAALTPAG